MSLNADGGMAASDRLWSWATVARLLSGFCLSIALHAALVCLPSRSDAASADKLSVYTYEDTKALVSLVEDAAGLMEQKGEDAFPEFAVKGSRWFNDQYYIFVYRDDGTCVFHPVEPDLVGRNLSGMRDMNGKPVIQLITDIARKPERDANGWVFYLWEDQTQITPDWKSAYIRKVISPSGRVYLVGAGVYDIKIEKYFVSTQVDRAVALLQAEGKEAAFKAFQDPASPFVFLGTYIFVLDSDGHTLVDPAYPTMAGRDMAQFRDMVGAYPMREVLDKLSRGDAAWVQYLWPRPGSATPSRKSIYARKIRVGNETLIVGSDFFLATPIWMKV